MAKKTSKIPEGEDQAPEKKPKAVRKTGGRKKVSKAAEPTDENSAEQVVVNSIVQQSVVEESHDNDHDESRVEQSQVVQSVSAKIPEKMDKIHPEEFFTMMQSSNPPLHSGMRDIKPKASAADFDADFLAPESKGFDLEGEKNNSSVSLVRNFFYFLSAIIIISALAVLALTIYSARSQQGSTNSAQSSTQNQQIGAATNQTSKPTLQILNSNPKISDVLANTISSKFADITLDRSSSNITTPNEDTLLFKTGSNDFASALATFLNQYGISAKLQEDNSINSNFALYLVTTLKDPLLSGYTATVYNSTGVSGAAKKYCTALSSFKVSSCSALNATSAQKGSTISYKELNVLFTLSRTTQFQGMNFSAAAQNQIEDIKVTLGN